MDIWILILCYIKYIIIHPFKFVHSSHCNFNIVIYLYEKYITIPLFSQRSFTNLRSSEGNLQVNLNLDIIYFYGTYL